jgi:hypothetical protein
MSSRIVPVTLWPPQTHRFLRLPEAPRLQGHSKTSHRPALRRVPCCRSAQLKPDRWSFCFIALVSAADRKLCLNCAYKILRSLNHLVRVGPVGLEPTTYGLKVRSSAN